MIKNIAIFASGSGTNAENIIHYFSQSSSIKVVGIFTNNREAGVIERSQKSGTPCFIFTNDQFFLANEIIDKLKELKTDAIILAGFLKLITHPYLENYPNKIINIHPALLPNYGGKGMYGMHIHEAVIKNKESESGITIHLVNEKYDKGSIIYQSKCLIDTLETSESLAKKIHQIEFFYFPRVIEEWLKN